MRINSSFFPLLLPPSRFLPNSFLFQQLVLPKNGRQQILCFLLYLVRFFQNKVSFSLSIFLFPLSDSPRSEHSIILFP